MSQAVTLFHLPSLWSGLGLSPSQTVSGLSPLLPLTVEFHVTLSLYRLLSSFASGTTYLGSSSAFDRTPAGGNNKKRPISPEQVLRLFGSQTNSNAKQNVDRPRRSPASSPASTTHQGNYNRPYGPSIHELYTRTVNMVREPSDGAHGFGICVKGGKEAGKYHLLT